MRIQNPRRGEAAASTAAAIVVEIPAHLKHLVSSIEKLVEAVKQSTAQMSRDGRAVDYAKFEREIAELTAAVETASHHCTLEAMAMDADRIEVGGATYLRVAKGIGTYYTLAGPVELCRHLYRRSDERNGPTIDVIAMRAGAIGDGWLPGAAQAMAHFLQLGTSREAERAAKQVGRLPYSRASFERVPHLVGVDWLKHHADIEDQLIRDYKLPEEAASISVAIDRTSVPMEEAVPRPPGRPRKNAPKRSVRRVFRMCYCATVTIHDKDGRALHTIRRGQMPNSDPQDMCDQLANDVLHLCEKRVLPIMLLADGAPEMWNLLDDNFPGSVFGRVHSLIDFWHVIEKLAAAAKVIATNDAEKNGMVWRWRHLLRARKDAVNTILNELNASGREGATIDGERPVHEAITYLQNHGYRMNYAGALWKRLPIGSGNVEATCKTLVGVRLKRCGSRWHNDTGNHVLHLRALAISDRWETAMDKLFATQRTSVRRRAA